MTGGGLAVAPAALWSGLAWGAFVLGLALSAGVLVRWGWLPFVPALLALAVMVVLGIVLGGGRVGLVAGRPSLRLASFLPAREAWLPLSLPLFLLAAGRLDWSLVAGALSSAGPPLGVIFVFSLLARALERSGCFSYLAAWLLLFSRGSPRRLLLGAYLLSAAVSLVTSNDVVILTLTPLFLGMAAGARLRDVRQFMVVGLFIPANLASMGMALGSPTNLILALELGLDFGEYFSLMAGPLAVCLVVSFALVWLASRRSRSLSAWPGVAPGTAPSFRLRCGVWFVIFLLAVAAYGVALSGGFSVWWVSALAFPAALVALSFGDWGLSSGPGGMRLSRVSSLRSALAALPWSVAVFACCLFLAVGALAREVDFPALYAGLASGAPVVDFLAALFGSALLVNLVNDLPAAAFLVELFPPGGSGVQLPAALVALNLGVVLTPAGSLAGLLWLSLCRRGGAELGLAVPGAWDLFKHGALHFLAAAVVLTLLVWLLA